MFSNWHFHFLCALAIVVFILAGSNAEAEKAGTGAPCEMGCMQGGPGRVVKTSAVFNLVPLCWNWEPASLCVCSSTVKSVSYSPL